MIIAVAAELPTTRAAIRRRLGHSQPVTTVCRRYRVRSAKRVHSVHTPTGASGAGLEKDGQVLSVENIRADHPSTYTA
jgi:hypothetical protein